jgi:CBS domain-containing protein
MSQEKTEKGDISLEVRHVMSKEVITLGENTSVKRAAEMMNKYDISSLIAVRHGKPVGIITERDLLKRVVAKGMDAKKIKVKDIMSTPLVTVTPETNLEEAVRLMFQKKIKKLAVFDQDLLVGLVSLTDIARCQPAIIKILKTLALVQNTPKSMKKCVECYIV